MKYHGSLKLESCEYLWSTRSHYTLALPTSPRKAAGSQQIAHHILRHFGVMSHPPSVCNTHTKNRDILNHSLYREELVYVNLLF